ncbi:hypothetical protein EJ05DRAFT_397816 [Pseudovirgaria hyperparasitica]|uniref:DNA replication factor Cdt1 C-terminal domain-containing protein n=1 Tax=Pseudovirgaria hyperparasitica TaxID=470096 RepID=A0A6A6W9C9_9PEZI|nr:uncharacterized protein EJ05DRAFT_397816 [Pseudovirgaria hyperparasitica]KAF2757691.1 hypothetical protein EJ05DRAFT_397816 [Pseudovirgaria hyperparasitica]
MAEPPCGVELPVELNHLIQLHSSMLSALSLHYAHNGTSAPVDLTSLVPSLTRLYRKRKVTVDDIQICIGQLQSSSECSSPSITKLRLTDYGRGRVCIELDGELTRGSVMDRQIDEDRLLKVFEEALKGSWSRWSAAQVQSEVAEDVSSGPESPKKRKRTIEDASITPQKRRKGTSISTKSHNITKAKSVEVPSSEQVALFIEQLPRAVITLSPSLEALTPSKRRGELLYAELKSNGSRSPSAKLPSTPTKKIKNLPSPSPSPSASSRGSSLLDRIRAKQAAAAASPKKQLSKQELARKAALSRASEVLDIITLIAQEKRRGDSTASMSLSSLVQQVQQSVRTPIGEDEICCVVDTLADIAQEYVKIVRTASMRYITINHHCKPSTKLLEERISTATALLT